MGPSSCWAAVSPESLKLPVFSPSSHMEPQVMSGKLPSNHCIYHSYLGSAQLMSPITAALTVTVTITTCTFL